MRRRLLPLTCALALAATSLAACTKTTDPRPVAGSGPIPAKKAYDPLAKPLKCLRKQGVPAGRGPLGIIALTGPQAGGSRVLFARNAADARGLQLAGRAEGAELIGQALLFTADASEGFLNTVEDCLDKTAARREY